MSIAPFLAVNNRTGTPQLQRYVSGTPTPFGATFGSADVDTVALDSTRGYPAAIKFGGTQTILATTGDQIYRSTDGGTSFSSVHTFSGTHLNASRTAAKSGLFVLCPNGVSTAVIVTSGGGTDYYAHTSTNGTSWTSYGPFTAGTSGLAVTLDSVVWNGRLVTLWGAPAAGASERVSTIFDPVTNTASVASYSTVGPGGTRTNSPLTVFNNRLFTIDQESSGFAQSRLMELSAGTWVQVGSLFSGATLDAGKICMFVDGNYMVAFYHSATWKCLQWDAAFTRTDITSLVVPTALASATGTSNRMSVIVDGRSTPGSSPTKWLYQSTDGNAATTLNVWQWNGVSSFVGDNPSSSGSQPNASGAGDARHNLPTVQHVQGATFYTATEDYIELKGVTPSTGGIDISFTMYSDDGLGTGNVRAFYRQSNDEYEIYPATLTGTTTGLAEDNTTVHTVHWDAEGDGIFSGEQVGLIFENY